MAEWVLMPSTKVEKEDYDCAKPCMDEDEWKYRVYVPLPPELVRQINVGEEIELTLKGEVKRVSITEENDNSSGEVCLRVKAVKMPSAKAPMEDYASSLVDDYED